VAFAIEREREREREGGEEGGVVSTRGKRDANAAIDFSKIVFSNGVSEDKRFKATVCTRLEAIPFKNRRLFDNHGIGTREVTRTRQRRRRNARVITYYPCASLT